MFVEWQVPTRREGTSAWSARVAWLVVISCVMLGWCGHVSAASNPVHVEGVGVSESIEIEAGQTAVSRVRHRDHRPDAVLPRTDSDAHGPVWRTEPRRPLSAIPSSGRSTRGPPSATR